jgi:hypothetical protein
VNIGGNAGQSWRVFQIKDTRHDCPAFLSFCKVES